MAVSFAQFQDLIREGIESSIVDLVLDPAMGGSVWWDLMRGAKRITRVGRATNIGGTSDAGTNAWQAEWRVKVARGGQITGARIGAGQLQMMGPEALLVAGQAANSVYLDSATTPKGSWASVKMLLKRMVGQVVLSKDDQDAMKYADKIVDVLADVVADAVWQQRAHITAHAWADGTASLAQFSAAGTIYEAAGSVTDANSIAIKTGTCFRFVKNARYVIGTNASPRVAITGSTSAGQPAIVRCVQVDPDTRRAWFQSEPGMGNVTIVADYHIMKYGNYDFTAATTAAGSLAFNGLESLIANTGTFPGTAWNVATFLELKGFVEGDESNPIDPAGEVLDFIIDKMIDAGVEPSSAVLVAEQSVWTLWAQRERQAGAFYAVPMGQTYSAAGGVSGPMYGRDGKTFTRKSDNQMRPGSIACLSPETWKLFVPMGESIEWLNSNGGVAGASGIFERAKVGNRNTDQMFADYNFYFEQGNENPRKNMRRIGLNSQRSLVTAA